MENIVSEHGGVCYRLICIKWKNMRFKSELYMGV